jgi:hypothetical protein
VDGWAVFVGESDTDKDGERQMVDGYNSNCDLVCKYPTGQSRLFVLYGPGDLPTSRAKPKPWTSDGATRFYFTRDGDKPVEYDGKTHRASFDPDRRLWDVHINARGVIQNAFHESWELHCEYPFGKTEFEAPPRQSPTAADEKKNEEEKKKEQKIPSTAGASWFHFRSNNGLLRTTTAHTDSFFANFDAATRHWQVYKGTDASGLVVCKFGDDWSLVCVRTTPRTLPGEGEITEFMAPSRLE